MQRTMLGLIAAVSLLVATACGEVEYLVQVSLVGYEDRLDLDIEPDDEVLHSIETVVRPGQPFHAKVETGSIEKKAGRTALTLSGKLVSGKGGDLTLNLKSYKSIDTGSRVPVGGGKEEAVLDQQGMTTWVTVPIGKPLLIGSLEKGSDSRREVWLSETGEELPGPIDGVAPTQIVESRLSKIQYMLLVTKYQPVPE